MTKDFPSSSNMLDAFKDKALHRRGRPSIGVLAAGTTTGTEPTAGAGPSNPRRKGNERVVTGPGPPVLSGRCRHLLLHMAGLSTSTLRRRTTSIGQSHLLLPRLP
ncbi:hypothetical protein VNO80_01500 [Phaseolus coccineus]|uniref:Uncharacterized protein n=1 Tax=Phaseolus coccineus TaxID=3886 RepID=A0AAN9WWV0_PHACN